jgi:hypothetical protein
MRIAVVVASSFLVFSGCAMTVKGVVSDRETGQPVALCAVGVSGLVVHTDHTGAYRIKVRVMKKQLEVSAAGYVPQTVPIVRATGSRYPVVDVQLERDREAMPNGAKYDPYTGKPMVPQFDPYTGKPIREKPTASR